ncbi:MAG TPA: relaxase MobL [Pyrinomonadaceae bacterium]|nr:relaxase MobL [Pyrinomonadaceae bacterium]
MAHSKIDGNKEPEKGREIFNAFTEHLTVQNANNFLKSDCGKGRPTNSDLHHLVLSFRQDDFLQLGSNDEERKRRLKIVTRFAIAQLERSLQSERLAWAGAVHLNTANPHVHIAIQKQYLTRDLHARSLNKIPREALPHFEIIDREKRIVDGILIESAKLKLQELVTERTPSRRHASKKQRNNNATRNHDAITPDKSDGNIHERDILRQGILAEYQLKFKEERIAFLIEHRKTLKFPVADPANGIRHKVSLKELEQTTNSSGDSQKTSQQRQIMAITNSILAKEESQFFKLKQETTLARKQADNIRADYKKRGAKLPPPAFNKQELDKLQNQCLTNSKLREFHFLEEIRGELETNKEINPRNVKDLELLAGQKVLSEMRVRLSTKQISDLKDNCYYRKVPVGKNQISLAMIDRQSNGKNNPGRSVLQSICSAIESLTSRTITRYSKSHDLYLLEALNSTLKEQSMLLQKTLRSDQKVVGILSKVLDQNSNAENVKPRFSAQQIIEIESLSRKLKMPKENASNWSLQKTSILAAESKQIRANGMIGTSAIGDVTKVVAGRAMAREILCNIGLNKAREDLAFYRKSKRFHKFAIEDKQSGSISYLSLNDVDLPRNASILDHGLNLLLEGRDHRGLRRELEFRVKDRERNLKADVAAAKDLSLNAGREVSEFRQPSLWGRTADPNYHPIFTTSEITEIEKRIELTSSSKEAKRLSTTLGHSARVNSERLNEILRRIFDPETRLETGNEHVVSQSKRRSTSDDRNRAHGRESSVRMER